MMINRDPPPRYCAYLLRCWQEQSLVHVGRTAWRFSLEDPHTGERRGFATWEAVVAFLEAKLRDAARDAAGAQVESDRDDSL
jgi:hypothetical protein